MLDVVVEGRGGRAVDGAAGGIVVSKVAFRGLVLGAGVI